MGARVREVILPCFAMIVVVTAKRCGREVTFRPLRLGWVLEQVLYVGSVPDSPFPAGESVASRDYIINNCAVTGYTSLI